MRRRFWATILLSTHCLTYIIQVGYRSPRRKGYICSIKWQMKKEPVKGQNRILDFTRKCEKQKVDDHVSLNLNFVYKWKIEIKVLKREINLPHVLVSFYNLCGISVEHRGLFILTNIHVYCCDMAYVSLSFSASVLHFLT